MSKRENTSQTPTHNATETSKKETVYTNPASSSQIIFVNTLTGELATNSDLNKNPLKKLDREVTLSQIAYSERIPISSYWENFSLLPPGCRYTYNHISHSGKLEIDLFNTKKETTDTPLEVLTSSISSRCKTNYYKRLVVRLSGGVDSTCILLSAIEAVGADRVTAITWLDEKSSANADFKAATALCEKLNISHLLFKFEPWYFFQEINLEDHISVSVSMASNKVFEKEIEFISSKINGDFIILDGHGGDHLFLDPVPPAAYQSLLKDKKIIKAAKAFSMFSKLSGLSFYEALISSYKQRNHDNYQRSQFFTRHITPPPAIERPRSLKEEYLQAIAQAIYQNTTHSNISTDILYPFTSKGMIEYALSQDPYDMFDNYNTRLPLRRAANAKYPNIELRRDKGHITSAYQKALKYHSNHIIDRLESSWLTQEKLINISHIKKAIRYSSMGFGGADQTLIKIACAALIKI
ncbi:asparagine synthase-related protein [Pseudomonas sp. TUM22785]|uniref:asparagine synthase-related protein n=1 Tax=Pseudomonas sp. TUM22785 TaxID=3019098 RepID=UPI002306D47E|nr:asparagine synthase-related protein [Pseudomonas sp. TUM22785]WCD78009.1 asparagine synthase-related protein [Pseudomonas sp. TUM22785]